jgi:hypothetical protein
MRSILLTSLLVCASAALALSGCGGSSDGDEGSGGSTSDESGGSSSSGGEGSDESGGSTSSGGEGSDESGGSTSSGGEGSDESGGSTSTGGVDGTSDLLEACYECGDEKCPDEATACDGAAGCRAYLTCQVECGSDATCLSECDLSTLTEDGLVAVSNYLACTLTDCLNECSGAPE